jgi:hypothetical protein
MAPPLRSVIPAPAALKTSEPDFGYGATGGSSTR